MDTPPPNLRPSLRMPQLIAGLIIGGALGFGLSFVRFETLRQLERTASSKEYRSQAKDFVQCSHDLMSLRVTLDLCKIDRDRWMPPGAHPFGSDMETK